jgi:ADP-heptose:LPS heptosyltransferase
MAAYSKICIVQLGRIGDLILTTPLIKTIRDAYPSAELHILAGRNNFFTLKGYPFVNSLHVHTKRPLKTVLLLLRLRRERFDLWIDPKDHHSTESRLFVRLARPRESVGFNRKNETLYTHSIKSNIEQFNDHAIDRYLNSVAFLGLKPAMQRPLLYCGKAAEEKIVSFLRINGITRYCHVHISASRPERYWEEAKWCALLKQLEEKNVFCLISAGPLDIELANRIAGTARNARYYPTPSLDDLYSIVNHAAAVISPDTAVIHIASAFNRPTVGLYADCGWNLNSFAPRADHSVLIVNKKSESLIKDIEAGEVFKAAMGILQDKI